MQGQRTASNTSTPRQRQTLVITARRAGVELVELRDLVGGSVSALSASECSDWIARFGVRLPHEPGQKRSSFRRRRARAIRIVTADHVEQIHRLCCEFFGDEERAAAWLEKNFKVRDSWQLETARRASQVIYVLRQMLDRRTSGGA